MGLERYRQKRDFSHTPEPAGSKEPRSEGRLFVIQKHAARRLHYDFRLELDGTLKSWAVPKGPSLDPGEKRLAVHVEDHPVEYGDFEGIIPPKQYGAGTVLLWDKGRWIPEGDPQSGYRKGRLKFRLEGAKLRGRWTLARMGGTAEQGKENWLLIKDRDEEARAGAEAEITERRGESVATGRVIEEVAARRERVWHSNRDAIDPSAIPGARKAPIPASIEPQLATLVDAMPTHGQWVCEIKYDGYRILARIHNARANLITRNGHDWTGRLPDQAREVLRLPAHEAWLDGEIVVLDAHGKPDFQALQNAFDAGTDKNIVYCLFDLLYLDGFDLRATPLVERKRLLHQLFQRAGHVPLLLYSDHADSGIDAIFAQACERGLEGLIGKQAQSAYVSGRSRNWIKLKCRRRQEFVVAGYTDPSGARTGFGALVLGVHDASGNLVYAGRVGTGFSERLLRDLGRRLQALDASESPFAQPLPPAEGRGVHWVRPELVAEVSFAEWTGDGVVRQASFEGLREDKPPTAIKREAPAPARAVETARPQANGREARREKPLQIAGVRITNPDKLLYRDACISKADLLHYYEDIADWVLPHLRHRPLAVVRCPDGRDGECFFQKHATDTMPEAVDAIEVREKDGPATYLAANSLAAVIGLVQMGVLEFHTWGATTPRTDRPDRITLDLDPDEGLPWQQVVEGALLMRTLLDELGLKSFLKTTGGKGLHIVVPLQRVHGWDEVKAFSHRIAQHLEKMIPARFTAKLAKNKRGGKIFIDYLRNAEGATAIAAFSPRARPGATVSAPLHWDELEPDLRPDAFTVLTLRTRLANLGADPWAEYAHTRQRITVSMKRALGMEK